MTDINDLYLLSRITDDLEWVINDLTVLKSETRDANVQQMVVNAIKIMEKVNFEALPRIRENKTFD
jgi:D-mannonate dehydratase